VVAMSVVFASNLYAKSHENEIDKKARVVLPREENTTPGDADDLLGRTKLDINQYFGGEADCLGPVRSSLYNDKSADCRIVLFAIAYLVIINTIILHK